MTSIIPLQNPQRRNNELTKQKVKKRFRPSGPTNMLGLFAITVRAEPALKADMSCATTSCAWSFDLALALGDLFQLSYLVRRLKIGKGSKWTRHYPRK